MGKSSAPPAPDYTGAAEKTAAGDLKMAQYATAANRPTEITPYGTKSWTNDRQFDQSGYDAAVKAAMGTPDQIGYNTGYNDSSEYTIPGTPAKEVDRYSFYGPDNWTSTISLDPMVQDTLNKQFGLSNQYADIAGIGLDKARSTLEDPTLDMSGIPDRAINQGQTAQQAIMARLGPEFMQQEEALRTRLANQGVGTGSEAFGNDFRQFNQKRNDAEMQAALQGINLDNQNRSSAIQEQAYLQDRPLNLINALRTGAQVQNPQFGGFSTQGTTRGPDYSGAAGNLYQADINSTNVDNANQEQMNKELAAFALMF